jgi:hypothetical protein
LAAAVPLVSALAHGACPGGRPAAGPGDAATAPDGAGADAGPTPDGPRPPDGAATISGRKLDLLFMIDNSSSMGPMQMALANAFPAFLEALAALPGGTPSLHIAVVSSSMGAGLFVDVPGCESKPYQNDEGRFHHLGVSPAGCAEPSGGFIVADPAGNNFTGSLAEVFGCIARIGDTGCGFEHPFASVRAALGRAQNPADSESYGFLRPDAHLGVVMLTNEDDCSVPRDSTLYDPRQSHNTDPLGGLQTGYRCQEFGLLCDGRKPPRIVTGDTPLMSCASAEDGVLFRVSEFVAFLRSVKPDPGQVSLVALGGPTEPYVVELRENVQTTDGSRESQAAVAHSCGPRMITPGSGTVFADPSVRIKQAIDSFGDHGAFGSVCSADLGAEVRRLAQAIARPFAAGGR